MVTLSTLRKARYWFFNWLLLVVGQALITFVVYFILCLGPTILLHKYNHYEFPFAANVVWAVAAAWLGLHVAERVLPN